MRYFKFIIFCLILTIAFVFIFDRKSFCWSLFDLFKNSKYSKSELNKILNFNPDEDALFLPELEKKTFFESVDDLSICRRQEVRRFIYSYLTYGRVYIKRAIERSNKYIPVIEEIFNENPDIPKDLMYLPLLESGFNPFAVSRTKATGLWQFVKITSRALDLRRDNWLDERRDVAKSTKAAIRHLRSQYKIFGSWDKALASYNGGAGYLKKQMRKHKTTNLWDMVTNNLLRRETNEYVPRFAAMLLIYKNQALFGIKDEIKTFDFIEIEELVLKYPVRINHLSKLTGIPAHLIREYNPELSKDITPPYSKGYKIKLPIQAKEKLAKEKKKLYKVKFSFLKKHKVKRGESITKIAFRYGSSVKGIIYINNISRPDFIRPGSPLYIPVGILS